MAQDRTPRLPSHDSDQISSLGKYQIQRKVGSGGMGAVYLAIDQQLKRTVALKVLPKDKASNLVLVRRFKVEGQAGAHLEHPNIVSVYESGEIDGYLYLAMEFVDGIDAYELLRKRGVLPAKRSLEIIKQVTQALQHAHEKQVVHRDIKPSNVMIRERDGVAKLADLGLARIIEDDMESSITKAGTTVGTVDYMSPEQGRDSKAADIRSDIYSLGCTWYHLLAGKAPYPDGDLMNKLRAHALQPVPDPRAWNENVPAGLVAVLQRMMAKKPEDRYQTPAQLLEDLHSPSLLRSDFSAQQLLMLGANHADSESSVGRDGEYDEIEDPKKPARGPVSAKPPRQGNLSNAAGDAALGSSRKMKGKVLPPVNREPNSSRASELGSAAVASDPGILTQSDRSMPGRVAQAVPAAPASTGIDPNTMKLWLLGVGLIITLGGILFAMQQFGGSLVTVPTKDNPYTSMGSGDVPDSALRGGAPVADVSNNTAPSPETNNLDRTSSGTPMMTDGGPLKPDVGSPDVLTPDLDTTPFGGVISISPDGKSSLPQWVWQSRVKTALDRVLIVRRSGTKEGEFRILSEILDSVHGDTIIEFADVGPHDIPAFEWRHSGRLTLRGVEGVAPVLIIRSASEAIRLSQGTLTLDGIHVVLMPEHTGPAIRVSSATLVVRQSTCTHLAPLAKQLLVAEASGRILLENSMLRATGTCCPVVLKGEKSSFVAGQSLLIAGDSSAIQIESNDVEGDTRYVHIVSSACLSGKAGLACLNTGRQPATYDLRWQQSVLAYLPGHSAEAVGVLFSGWPQAAESLDRPRVSFVNWVAENSSFVGWPNWAQLGFVDGTPAIDVHDTDAWQAFWSQPVPTGVLVSEGADLRAVSESGVLASAGQVQVGLTGIRSPSTPVGPKWSELPIPPQSILTNVISFAEIPMIPESLESPDPGKILRFDLKKPTLGRFIGSDECPDGSTVIAFGAGLRTVDPFVIFQKRIQLVFEQTDGAPLIIQPGYKNEANGVRPVAWISVEDGQLTLSKGSFRMMNSTTRNYPERFLKMSGGMAAVRNCRVEGVESNWPLIDTIPSAGHAPPQLLVDQSLIVGEKSLVRIGAAESVIEVRGSALYSSVGVTMTLDTGSAGSQCLISGSTLSAGKSAFQVFPVGAGGPVHLYSRRTVYQGGGVMSLETDATSVHWWGDENAYASGMRTFLLTQGEAGIQDFVNDWAQGWGAGHELLAVYGAGKTLLPHVPQNLGDIVPQSFQLHAECEAAQAGPVGAGLGATLSLVGPGMKKPQSEGPSPKTDPQTLPANPQKNNPGF